MKHGNFSTRLFGKECEQNGMEPNDQVASFSVKDIAEFNHLSERFFLMSIEINVPRDHPRRPLDPYQERILDAHVIINDGEDRYDYLVSDTINPNMFDLGYFVILPDNNLHLSPEAIITVDVFADTDFFFKINYFIAPL